MKKLAIFFVLFLITGCAQQGNLSTNLSYNQYGKDCIYREEHGYNRYEKNLLKKEPIAYFDLYSSNEIKYENIQCSKVMDSDLKNGINKTMLNDGTLIRNSVSSFSSSTKK